MKLIRKPEFWVLTLTAVATAWATIALAVAASPAEAQTANCGTHEAVGIALAERWGETVQMRGLGSNGALVEFWGNEETETWSITVTTPGGPTCLVASGDAYALTPAGVAPSGEEM